MRFFRYRQSNVWRFLKAPDYRRARGYQIVLHSSDNESVLGRGPPVRAAEHKIDGSEKRICQLTF